MSLTFFTFFPGSGRAGDFNLINYGSIRDKSMEEILFHPYRDSINARQSVLAASYCQGCRFWGICHGGCPVDALAVTGNLMNPSDHCRFIRRLLEKYIEPITGLKADCPPPTGSDSRAMQEIALLS